VHAWAQAAGKVRPEVLRLGYFGSYARGDWGVGSDLDVVVLVDRTDLSFTDRSAAWDLLDLPVPAQALVYTSEEWQSMAREAGRFYRTLLRETKWVYQRAPAPDPSLAEEEIDWARI